MQESDDNIFLEKQQENVIHVKQEEDEAKERSAVDDMKVIKDVKEMRRDEEIDGKVATFLHEKGLSENLIETLINTGLTDERVRLAGIKINFRYSSHILIRIERFITKML